MPSTFELSVHFSLQLAVILTGCRLAGMVLRRLGQPQVIADMAAGFMLGPSLLGLLSPGFQEWLFPITIGIGAAGQPTTDVGHPSLAILYVVGQLGLILYMFVVGLRLDLSILSGHLRHSVVTSLAGFGVPLLLGGALGFALVRHSGIFPSDISSWEGALFVGAVLAVTAFPMLARIVSDCGLGNTRVGVLALACAAVDDASAWILLSFVVLVATGDPTAAVVALVGGITYVAAVVVLGRPLLRRLAGWAMTPWGLRPEAFMATLVILLFGSWTTDVLGVHAVFGAFVVGTVMPRGQFSQELCRRIEPVTVTVLLPVFFICSGLQTHVGLLFDAQVFLVFLAVLAVAVVSKGLACFVAAVAAGLERNEAASLGALMNARGLTELILLNIGLQVGMITDELFTVFVLMTIVTTLGASPLHMWFRRRHERVVGRAGIDGVTSEPVQSPARATTRRYAVESREQRQ